ncbi:AtpZ/AtpI family protein [Phenylobacterium sp.]|jgi:ATP synthase protein I|uniref:AtpZ/AtpI family protein n=1 Tax=Phenylobacterium sp. TaxID=1871053 RepID=UPI002F421527
MPKSDEPPREAPHSLQARLDAFEAERTRKSSPVARLAVGQGYRFLGEVVGGVLGGAGFGWLIDRFAHTTPLGLICGLLIGTGLSVFVAVKSAAKVNNTATEAAGPLPGVPDEDEDD